ncbi:hypothetical protein E2542_SST12021 [Spatholobus suberectus]|nr:hypothetical protein E2542_SST12021 [Spatholobus suberectus]
MVGKGVVLGCGNRDAPSVHLFDNLFGKQLAQATTCWLFHFNDLFGGRAQLDASCNDVFAEEALPPSTICLQPLDRTTAAP